MYKITWNDPFGPGERNSIVEFFIGDKKYYGKIHEDNRKWFIYSFTSDLLHKDFVDSVFKPLGMSPKEYYKHVLGPGFDSHGKWPEASPGDFYQVLVHMRRDYEKINESEKKKPTLDFSKFRFRAGDTVSFMGEPCVIVGYYFASSHFNDFDHLYGYVIAGHSLGHHNGSKWGFDQWGNHLPDDDSEDKYYICENDVSAGSIKKQLTLNNKQLKTKGYEIKLQRTKSSIRRGEVPEGSRVRSKVHKTSISIQHLSYTEIVS